MLASVQDNRHAVAFCCAQAAFLLPLLCPDMKQARSAVESLTLTESELLTFFDILTRAGVLGARTYFLEG